MLFFWQRNRWIRSLAAHLTQAQWEIATTALKLEQPLKPPKLLELGLFFFSHHKHVRKTDHYLSICQKGLSPHPQTTSGFSGTSSMPHPFAVKWPNLWVCPLVRCAVRTSFLVTENMTFAHQGSPNGVTKSAMFVSNYPNWEINDVEGLGLVGQYPHLKPARNPRWKVLYKTTNQKIDDWLSRVWFKMTWNKSKAVWLFCRKAFVHHANAINKLYACNILYIYKNNGFCLRAYHSNINQNTLRIVMHACATPGTPSICCARRLRPRILKHVWHWHNTDFIATICSLFCYMPTGTLATHS